MNVTHNENPTMNEEKKLPFPSYSENASKEEQIVYHLHLWDYVQQQIRMNGLEMKDEEMIKLLEDYANIRDYLSDAEEEDSDLFGFACLTHQQEVKFFKENS